MVQQTTASAWTIDLWAGLFSTGLALPLADPVGPEIGADALPRQSLFYSHGCAGRPRFETCPHWQVATGARGGSGERCERLRELRARSLSLFETTDLWVRGWSDTTDGSGFSPDL